MELLRANHARRARPAVLALLALFCLGCASLHTLFQISTDTQVPPPSLTFAEAGQGTVRLMASGLDAQTKTVELFRRNYEEESAGPWTLRTTVDLHGEDSLEIHDTLDDNPKKIDYVIVAKFDDAAPLRSSLLVVAPPSARPAHSVHTKVLASRFVEVNWICEERQAARIFRRDVLAGEQPPGLFLTETTAQKRSHFVDQSVRPGGVYAYSIETIITHNSQRWSTGLSQEVYVSVPLDAPQ